MKLAFWKVSRTIRGSGRLSSLHAIHGHRWGVAKWSNNNQAARVWRIRYILRNITAPLSDRASSSLYSNSHPFNPFNSRRSQAWHLDTLSLRIGTNGYIAICTVATINLPPSITALERDSPIYERLPLRPRMLHAWISPLVLPLRRAARIYSTRLLDSPPLDRVVKFNYREIKRELRNLYLEMEKESEMISN